MLDSRLKRDSQTRAIRIWQPTLELEVLASLPILFHGTVGKDYEELIFVILTMGISMGLMLAFGAWWSR